MGSMSKKRQRDSLKDDGLNDHITPKRKRTYTEQDQKLAKIYDQLADERKEIRIQAAKDLVTEFSAEKEPSGEFIEKNLARLIKGLCSSRKHARFGFSVALSELLRQFYCQGKSLEGVPDLGKLIEKIEELTVAHGDVAGQERRDHLFGRVFAYKALLQSSALLSSEEAKLEHWPSVLDHIYELAKTVPWLREECGLMLCNYVNGLETSESELGDHVKEIVSKLESHEMSKTPEGVAIWVTIQAKFPDVKLPKGVWKKNDPLCSKERSALMNAMRESNAPEPVDEDKKAKDKAGKGKKDKVKTGTWQQRPNFAWDIVLQEALRQKPKASSFQQFWIEIVDNGLFSPKSSAERKFWGLAAFSRMILTAPDSIYPVLFSKNLMHCLIDHLATTARNLHAAVTDAFKAMKARLKRQPSLTLATITKLLTEEGTIAFDRITKTKTIEDLLSNADDSSLVEVLDLFEQLIRRPSTTDQKTADSNRQILADLLVSTVKNHIKDDSTLNNLDTPDSWLRKALNTLALFGYFVTKETAASETIALPPISSDGRKIFQSRLSSCLTYIFSKAKDASPWPLGIVLHIDSQSKTSESYTLAVEVDDRVAESIELAHKTLKSLRKQEKSKDRKRVAAMRAFRLLYAFTLLQVYGTDADAVSMLDELRDCYTLLISGSEEAAQPFALLVELLLSFLSKSGTLYKRLAEQTFPAFTAEIDEETLLSLFDILAKSESLSGQQDLFDQEDSIDEADEEAEENSDDEDDDGELDSDVEMLSANSEEEGEGSESDDGELQRFNALLADTLKTSLPNGEAPKDDADEDTSDGEDMDDEQMMALEPHLTKIFKQRSALSNGTKKKEKKDAKETMTNFKNRVLDLLDIYVEREFRNPLALKLLLPLVQTIRTTTSQQVSKNAHKVMHDYFNACNKNKAIPSPSSDDEVEAIWELLREVHEEVKQRGSNQHSTACSRISQFLAKILVNLDWNNIEKLIEMYAETSKERTKNPKVEIQTTFFTAWESWVTEALKQKKITQKAKV